MNALWLTAITFLCVGYGDIVPNTYCGRGITVVCGMMVSLFRTRIFLLFPFSLPRLLPPSSSLIFRVSFPPRPHQPSLCADYGRQSHDISTLMSQSICLVNETSNDSDGKQLYIKYAINDDHTIVLMIFWLIWELGQNNVFSVQRINGIGFE